MHHLTPRLARAAVVVVGLAALAACAPKAAAPAAVDTSKDVAAITELENQAVAMSVGHQADAFGATYSPDGVFVSPGSPPARGPSGIATALKAFTGDAGYGFKLTMDRVEVSKDGTLAYALWRYDQTSTDPKTHQPAHEIGSGMDALRKGADGKWLFVASINTPSPDAAPAGTPAATPAKP